MDTCVVDKVPDKHTPPSKEAIEQAREKQLAALQGLRRLLIESHKMIRAKSA